MNRKQFVQFTGVGAAVVATGGMTGFANKPLATSVVNNGARADKAPAPQYHRSYHTLQ